MVQIDPLADRERFAELFDIYSPILSPRQREACEIVLGDDLTLPEMASELGLTRQGAHDIVRRARASLERAEASLHLKALADERDALVEAVERHRGELPAVFLDEVEMIEKRRCARDV